MNARCESWRICDYGKLIEFFLERALNWKTPNDIGIAHVVGHQATEVDDGRRIAIHRWQLVAGCELGHERALRATNMLSAVVRRRSTTPRSRRTTRRSKRSESKPA